MDSANWKDGYKGLLAQPVLPPFDPVVLDFIDAVSKRLLLEVATRSLSELMVVAHWMRMAHLLELRREFRRQEGLRVARGVVVHFAPANVDSIFLYSWFLSLLVGDSNLVRLSTRRGLQMNYLLATINHVLDQPAFAAIRARNLILSYEHDDSVSTILSAGCDVRVLWGGDQTIAALRRLELPPLATELVFADRFSLAALNAAAIVGLQHKPFHELVCQFFNDTFWFDQLACSSPRLVAWIGERNDLIAAQKRFWPALKAYVTERRVSYPAVVGINRMTALYACAARGEIDHLPVPVTEFPARAHLGHGILGFREHHCGGGLFFETERSALPLLADILTSKDQTLCYFGFNRDDLTQLARILPTRSIDRMVPVGRALAFSHVWDGVDLLHAFSRRVDIN
jgi:hypothetical protein